MDLENKEEKALAEEAADEAVEETADETVEATAEAQEQEDSAQNVSETQAEEDNTENAVVDGEEPLVQNTEVSADDFSFFFSILDENSDNYAWAKSQLENTVPVNDIVEEYEAAEQARLEAEEKARLEAEEQARLEAEEQARLKAEEQARLEAEEQARLEAEEKARLEAEEKARLEAEEQARLEAEEQARLKAEEQARLEAEEPARLEAEEQARLEAEEKARLEAEEKARLEAEEKMSTAHVTEANTAAAEKTESMESAVQEKNDTEKNSFAENMVLYVTERINAGASKQSNRAAENVDKSDEIDLDGFADFDDLSEDFDDDDIEMSVETGKKKNKKTLDDKLEKLKAAVDDNFGTDTSKDKAFGIRKSFTRVFAENDTRDSAALMGVPRKAFCLATIILFAVDMLLINSASYKIVYKLMEKLLLSNGVEALRLTDAAFSRIFVGVSYIASFLLGGFVVLMVAKLAEYIIRGLGFSKGRAVVLGIVGIFVIVFLIGTGVVALKYGNLLTVDVYRWAGPLLTYLGGMLLIAISKINLSIDY